MKSAATPKDGDFASCAEQRQNGVGEAPGRTAEGRGSSMSLAEPRRQTVEDVLIGGEAPSEEFLQEWNALENAPELSDEEIANQALVARGEDGDPRPPE